MKNILKLSLLFILFNSHLIVSNKLYTYQQTLNLAQNAQKTSAEYQTREGFLQGTLILTPQGYVPVEQLNIGDFINGKDVPQEILYIKKVQLNEYYIIQIDNELIKVAPHQKFYLTDGSLVSAEQLKIDDCLQNESCIYQINLMQESCTAFCLSTQDQSFFIYPNIAVHNFDVVTLGTISGTFALGVVEFSNPITLTIGAVTALAFFATQYFKQKIAIDFEFDYEDPDLTAENLSLHNYDTWLQTRLYYQTKRKELIDLYQKVTNLKYGILAIRPNNNPLLFAQFFLTPLPQEQYSQLNLPDVSYEYNLSAQNKAKLLETRNADLEKIEQDIFDLHFILAFYTNEIIELRDLAKEELENITKEIILDQETWNNNKYNISLDVALNHYFRDLIWQNIIDTLERKNNEIKFIISYYDSLKTHFFITTTTNLSKILNSQANIYQSILNIIQTNASKFKKDVLVIEEKLQYYNALSPELINNFKSQIQQERTSREKEILGYSQKKKNAACNAIKDAIKKQQSAQTPNIKGLDKDPDDDWFEKLKKIAKRKALHYKFKKFYKDSQTDLWWSKDNGSAHAGPHYKVFQERATHLEWIRDVDLLGKVMEKHKGPIGQIIPFKELIFY